MKKIIICIDGTWNKKNAHSLEDQCDSNVAKISRYIADHDVEQNPQIVHYFAGVGTSDKFWQRLWEGYSGQGTSRRILRAYCRLIRDYQPGDKIYLLGFSRGAFAVRSLAGLINQCGILDPNKHPISREHLFKAYDFYRDKSIENKPTQPKAIAFRQDYAIENCTPIEFIGVWDTVGSLGNPMLPSSLISKANQFHDTTLSSHVTYAYQALAICERRWLFSPCIWQPSLEHGQPKNPQQVLEQRWFIGAHADIGGGYAECGIANHTLAWMISNAKNAGLNFQHYQLDLKQQLCVHDETHTNWLHRIYKKLDRVLCANQHSQEKLNEDVEAIFKGNIPVKWFNPKYKLTPVIEYYKRSNTSI